MGKKFFHTFIVLNCGYSLYNHCNPIGKWSHIFRFFYFTVRGNKSVIYGVGKGWLISLAEHFQGLINRYMVFIYFKADMVRGF